MVEDWGRRLESVRKGYQLRDIFNADETGLFYRALPTKSMSVKGEEAKGGRKSKERITVLLVCSAEGEKLRPFVIGHAPILDVSKAWLALHAFLLLIVPTKRLG